MIADFGPRNVMRLLSFLLAAPESDRRLCITAKDAYFLQALYSAGESGVPDPSIDPNVAVYVEHRGHGEMGGSAFRTIPSREARPLRGRKSRPGRFYPLLFVLRLPRVARHPPRWRHVYILLKRSVQ